MKTSLIWTPEKKVLCRPNRVTIMMQFPAVLKRIKLSFIVEKNKSSVAKN